MTASRRFGCILLLTLCFHGIRSQSANTQEVEGLDCSDIWQKKRKASSGVYIIKPDAANAAFQVYCEITENEGWTVLQHRNGLDGVRFNETWIAYENGFGNIAGEHWLGLKKMNILTHQRYRQCKLHIDLEDFSGNTAYAEYQTFRVGPASENYPLKIGNYSGTAGDSFIGTSVTGTNQYGSAFSTKDAPNDSCSPQCALGDMLFESCSGIFNSGWWFNSCGLANLNGYYQKPPSHKFRLSSVAWPTWRLIESLKTTKMSVSCS